MSKPGRAPAATLCTALLGVLLAVPVAAQRVVDLPGQDKVLAGPPQTLYTVGREDGETPDVFAGVNAVMFDKAGNLYVLDRDNAHVVVFGTDGKVLRTVGKRGEGPGELGIPMSMTPLPDGGLAIMDMANRAISRFDAAGKYVDIVSVGGGGGGMMIVSGATGLASPTSAGIIMQGSNLRGGGPGGGMPEVADSIPILLQPFDGPSKVLFSAPSPAPTISGGDQGGGRVSVMVGPPPTFSPRVLWTALPDGRLAVTWGLDYDVNIVPAAGGSVASVLRRPQKARRVTEKDEDAARTAQRKRLESGTGVMSVRSENGRMSMSSGGLSKEQIERSLQRMTFAETMPVVQGLRADLDGRVWVQHDAGPGVTDYPIDILGANGTYFGTVEGMPMPDALGAGGLMAFIETDDLGVQRVSVKRAPAAWFR